MMVSTHDCLVPRQAHYGERIWQSKVVNQWQLDSKSWKLRERKRDPKSNLHHPFRHTQKYALLILSVAFVPMKLIILFNHHILSLVNLIPKHVTLNHIQFSLKQNVIILPDVIPPSYIQLKHNKLFSKSVSSPSISQNSTCLF